MSDYRPAFPDQAEFLAELIDVGHLVESGVPGIYGRGEDFERIRLGFDARVTALAMEVDDPESLSFPPLLPREQLERIRYLTSFPHLAGTVFAFDGDEQQASEQEERAARHEDWSEYQQMTDLVLAPAACHQIYPVVAGRGKLAPGGLAVDTGDAYVFRREPSGDPTRLQIFHMREIVRIAEPGVVIAWRDGWRDRSVELLRSVGLDAGLDVASDPFFGRSGEFLADRQRAQELKFEILVQIAGPEATAVASSNYHQEHFTSIYEIEIDAPDPTAHTACMAFGLERITLALLRRHGLDLGGWPDEVRAGLGLA